MPLFSVAEARAYDKGQLSSPAMYADAVIAAKETAVRAKFEREIGVALQPTANTEYYDGDGTDTLCLRHHNPWAEPTPRPVTLTSITLITGGAETAFTAAELSDVAKYPNKLVRRSGVFPAGLQNIKVVYTAGYTAAPDDIKLAALQALLLPPPEGLVPSSVTSYAVGGNDEPGAINWARIKDPDRGRWYGNELVDGTLREHRAIETSVPVT